MFRGALDFQAKFYGFANALGDLVEGPRLRMAGRYLRNRGYVVAFRIALNHNIELKRPRAAGSRPVLLGPIC